MQIEYAQLLPLSRMARRLHVTVGWLRSEADAGRVPCLRADKRYLFVPDVVERSLAALRRKRKAAPDDAQRKVRVRMASKSPGVIEPHADTAEEARRRPGRRLGLASVAA